MKVFKSLLFVVLGLAVFASCSNDDDDKIAEKENSTRVQVVMKTSTITARSNSTEESPLDLKKLYINIAEIEFDISDDMEHLLPGDNKVYSDIELKGPFPINLLSEKALSGWVLSTTNVPNATYEEIEFEFDIYKGKEAEFEDLKGSTIYASGTFKIEDHDIPFVIKSDEDLEIELEYKDGGLVLDGTNSKVFIDLNLHQVITNLIHTTSADFVNAQRETDGSILIDKNKNKNLLDKFEDIIEDAFEALEEKNENDD